MSLNWKATVRHRVPRDTKRRYGYACGPLATVKPLAHRYFLTLHPL